MIILKLVKTDDLAIRVEVKKMAPEKAPGPNAMVAGVRYEAQQRVTREPELVALTFEARGKALIPG